MKRITLMIVLAMAAIMLSSCSSGMIVYDRQTDKLPANGTSWTVLVYMCASDAEAREAAYSDKLKQMMSVDYPENVTVAVQTGGSDAWHMKGVYGDYLQRFEAGKNTLYLADQSVKADMGDYRTLADFINWGFSNYSSDKYMLILSGTGGNCIDGMCYDSVNMDNSLNLEEISYAMSLSSRKFDIVGLDASLMGSIETASALSTYGDYLVSSQDIQSESGWDYAGFLQYLCGNPNTGEEDICRAICDTYYKRCISDKTASCAAMSVTDMSKISTLNQAFDGMAGDMLTATDSLQNLSRLLKAMDTVHVYGGAVSDEGYSNLIDVGDIAVKAREYVGNTADMLIESLNDTVIYRVCGEEEKSSTGLSVYYPLDSNSEKLQKYMDIATSAKYKEFLRKARIDCLVEDESEDYTSSWSWNTYNEDMQTMEYNSILDGNSYELNILGNMDMFKKVSINVYKADKDGEYVFIGNYDDIDSDWEAGIFKDSFDGKLLKLCSKTVSPSLAGSYEDYDVYSIPVILNGTRSNVRVVYDKNSGKYKVVGAWQGVSENGSVLGTMKKIGFFDRISPVLSVYDDERNKTKYKTGALAVSLARGASEKSIESGSYILEYELTDMYGLKRRGTPVNVSFESGTAHFK